MTTPLLQMHTFLTSILARGGERLTSRPGQLTPTELSIRIRIYVPYTCKLNERRRQESSITHQITYFLSSAKSIVLLSSEMERQYEPWNADVSRLLQQTSKQF